MFTVILNDFVHNHLLLCIQDKYQIVLMENMSTLKALISWALSVIIKSIIRLDDDSYENGKQTPSVNSLGRWSSRVEYVAKISFFQFSKQVRENSMKFSKFLQIS